MSGRNVMTDSQKFTGLMSEFVYMSSRRLNESRRDGYGVVCACKLNTGATEAATGVTGRRGPSVGRHDHPPSRPGFPPFRLD